MAYLHTGKWPTLAPCDIKWAMFAFPRNGQKLLIDIINALLPIDLIAVQSNSVCSVPMSNNFWESKIEQKA